MLQISRNQKIYLRSHFFVHLPLRHTFLSTFLSYFIIFVALSLSLSLSLPLSLSKSFPLDVLIANLRTFSPLFCNIFLFMQVQNPLINLSEMKKLNSFFNLLYFVNGCNRKTEILAIMIFNRQGQY